MKISKLIELLQQAERESSSQITCCTKPENRLEEINSVELIYDSGPFKPHQARSNPYIVIRAD